MLRLDVSGHLLLWRSESQTEDTDFQRGTFRDECLSSVIFFASPVRAFTASLSTMPNNLLRTAIGFDSTRSTVFPLVILCSVSCHCSPVG